MAGLLRAAIAATGWPQQPGMVQIETSDWDLTSTVVVDGGGLLSTPPLVIDGQGSKLSTTLGIPMFVVTNSVVSTTRVTIRDVLLRPNARGATAVVLSNAQLCRLDGVQFTGSFGTAVRVLGSSTHNRIVGCDFSHLSRGVVVAGPAHFTAVHGCHFAEGLSGDPFGWVDVTGNPLGGSVVGCTFDGYGATAPLVNLAQATGWRVRGNAFWRAPTPCVYVGINGSSGSHSVGGNTHDSCATPAVLVDGGKSNVVESSTMRASVGAGPLVQITNRYGGGAGSDNLVHGNVADRLAASVAAGAAGVLVADNVEPA